MSRFAFVALMIGAGVLSTNGASAQLTVQPAAGVRFESYSFSSPEKVGIDKVTLLTTPISVRIGLTRQLELQVTGAYARGAVQRGTAEETLSGPIDTEVRLSAALMQD